MKNREELQTLSAWAIKHRRYLHQYPELSGEEHKTNEYIKRIITGLGLEILDFPHPSLVAFLPGTKGSKTIALRADTDALPVHEEGEKAGYISKVPGVAHVCGHDGHTAILLAVAKWMSENHESIVHNVKFIFQSSEEISPSGALELVNAGVLEDVDAIFGIHLWQGLKKGSVGLTHGPMMGSSDDFEIVIEASGGHGSLPHETIDPTYIASHLIQSYQAIVSRQINPVDPSVISIGKIEGGTNYNIIPSTVTLSGSMRAVKTDTRDFIKKRILEQTNGICASFLATAKVEFIDGTPPVVNDSTESMFVEKVITEHLGANVFSLVDVVMAAEDFSFYLNERPGAFIFVGMNGEKSQYPHHHPKFDLDEEVFESAIHLFIKIVQQYPSD
ncbi:M20 metallopeptidase family protein [Sporosarcina ureilytica]|uniref:N-acyl-L-amino acid amidohydrolase n=1 Tax=Sporosarcina ureilytica TaxID=298596 RepID=A0A1D8JH42_9BACL|nr:amidohydrolase [Sporosarcina ureilytica]AOV08004.1 N-acyl-L-amino acid amidohydrolase [Sporosarcina ureilytica]